MSESAAVSVKEVEEVIKSGIETEKLVVVDVSGGCGAKFELYISSSTFVGKKLLDRHRLVNGLLTSSGLMAKIHAVTIKAWTPEEFEKNQAQVTAAQQQATQWDQNKSSLFKRIMFKPNHSYI